MIQFPFKSGQIIKTEAYTFASMPVMYHFGLVLKEKDQIYIIHNDRKNGTIKQSYEDFIYNEGDVRKVSEVKRSKLENLTNNEIITRFNKCAGDFHWLDYNCEHFVDCMLKNKIRSEQINLYALTAITLIILL